MAKNQNSKEENIKLFKRLVTLSYALLDSLRLAYCISLHKAQGSQCERIIIWLSSTPMIDRCWIYTALTRAEKEIHIVGPRKRMVQAIRRTGASDRRRTYLHRYLQEFAVL